MAIIRGGYSGERGQAKFEAARQIGDTAPRRNRYIGPMHCPHCGEPTPEAAAVCPHCGARLEQPASAADKPMARTMVGIPQAAAVRAAAARAGGALHAGGASPDVSDEALTIAVSRGAGGTSPAASAPAASSIGADARGHEAAAKTMVGMRPPTPASLTAPKPEELSGGFEAHVRTQVGFRALASGAPAAPSPPASFESPRSSRPERPPQDSSPRSQPITPSSSARPSDSAPSASKPEPRAYAPGEELGVTVAPKVARKPEPAKRLAAHALNVPRLAIPPLKPPKVQKPEAPWKAPKADSPRATIALLAAAVIIVSGAIAFAILWSGRSPLKARVRLDTQGAEVVELSCLRCPDGTTLTSGQATAVVSGGLAVLTPEKPLSPGENHLKVKIDRPGNERDETVTIAANVAYRLRPDLSALQGEKPAIQVLIEAAKGTQVTLDGRPISLYAGRATESFDVTEACTGLAADATSITRQIPYVVTTPDGEERGSVNVVVGVVPLELDAPGPNVVIDGPSFVIAGRTTRGAELFAANRPIPVKPDGSFAHVMNVSSVGSTQIDVRAKIAGMAPRIAKIRVRRVENLETAAKDFAGEAPITFAALAANIGANIGKAIAVPGQVVDIQHDGRRTIMILDVSSPGGCQGCSARLIQGAEVTTQVGDAITAYGHVLRAVRLPERGEIPEIQVDFTLKGRR